MTSARADCLPFREPFKIELGEYPEPDTILDADNKPVPLEWLCDRLNQPSPARSAGLTGEDSIALVGIMERMRKHYHMMGGGQGQLDALLLKQIIDRLTAEPPAVSELIERTTDHAMP